MKLLLDHNVPFDLCLHLTGHLVMTAGEMGWSRLSNGDLLKTAEAERFDVFVTADQGIFYQQNNLKRRIALVVLSTNHWGRISKQVELVSSAVDGAVPSGFTFIEFEGTEEASAFPFYDWIGRLARSSHQRQKLIPRLKLRLEDAQHGRRCRL